MEPAAICNSCGNESPAWDKFCKDCDKEVICKGCGKKYKRGQGLQEVDLCVGCLNEADAREEEREQVSLPDDFDQTDPHEEYGFDHQWELYDK